MISTKIIATIGPACDTKEKIEKLYGAGMKIARLNFSHGDYKYFKKIIRIIRKIDLEIAIMMDTKGPEIRTGKSQEELMLFSDGDIVELTNEDIIGTKDKIKINYEKLYNVKVGTSILLDDGLMELVVIKKGWRKLIAKVINGGILGSHKSVSIHEENVSLAFLCKKDKEDILFGIENKVDMIAASFVRSHKDVIALKKFLKNNNSDMPIISKIEHPKAVEDSKKIIDESFGIMIARGDLGVEIPLEEIPKVQEQLIKECNHLGKPVIVATQMLESMKELPRPTRAEVADVAHAILHGADCVMLSAETAIGKYPFKAVQMMASIAKQYDPVVRTQIADSMHSEEELKKRSISLFITRSAYEATRTLPIKAIVAPTESGYTARKVARFRPKCPVYAFTHNYSVLRQLQFSWGVVPFVEKKHFKKHDELLCAFATKIHDEKLLTAKDRIVVTSGHILSKGGHTNMIEIYKIKYLLDKKYLKNL